MTNSTKQKPGILFWTISIISVLWYAKGVEQYLHQAYRTDSFKAMYPDEKVLEMVYNTPAWVNAAFAIAVIIGLIGCVLLLLRKKWATNLLLISLVAAVAQAFYNIFISKALEVYGNAAVIMPVVVIAYGAFIYFYAKKLSAKGILK